MCPADLRLSVFLVPATTQMTFKHYNPHTKKAVWKSVNTSALKTDGRSSKTDAFVRALHTFPRAPGAAGPLTHCVLIIVFRALSHSAAEITITSRLGLRRFADRSGATQC